MEYIFHKNSSYIPNEVDIYDFSEDIDSILDDCYDVKTITYYDLEKGYEEGYYIIDYLDEQYKIEFERSYSCGYSYGKIED